PATRLGIFAGCGIAAGMSAAYYAPFGAALFAMEVVLGNFAVDVLAPVFIASAVSSLLVQALATDGLLGEFISGPPLYRLPHFELLHAGEYVIYIVLGFASAGAAWLFVRAMRDAERFFQWLPIGGMWKLPLAGLALGLIGIWLPHVWGNGYHAVTLVLADGAGPALGFVIILFLMKIFATAITIGSGGSGGIFTPTLFVGAAAGLIVGVGAHAILPEVAHDPRTYAVVGMAAVLAATTHAPIMAMILLLEMTRETDVFLPMMVSAITASVFSRVIGVESVYLSPLRRRGVMIPEGIEETALTTTRVEDIMRSEAVWIRETATFDMIVGMVEKTRRDCIYVVAESEELLGVIRIHDIKNFLADATSARR
ncbi:MAG: CBS domain-containing protein, partial [Planctomycetes bacterium]|nr:CBS domain-containing protein [Planctomycetota bacterium]